MLNPDIQEAMANSGITLENINNFRTEANAHLSEEALLEDVYFEMCNAAHEEEKIREADRFFEAQEREHAERIAKTNGVCLDEKCFCKAEPCEDF